MNVIAVPVPVPVPARGLKASPRILVVALLTILFGILFAWTVTTLLSIQPVPVPLVPCRTCAEKCPCPRLSGTIRCGCAN